MAFLVYVEFTLIEKRWMMKIIVFIIQRFRLARVLYCMTLNLPACVSVWPETRSRTRSATS
jgi:hypothetical protein